ncbi:MAG: thioredoxin family protein [Proteobacteria bacterium]|nr:thioredoxin family protein [Pseudomonadota bacterium]
MDRALIAALRTFACLVLALFALPALAASSAQRDHYAVRLVAEQTSLATNGGRLSLAFRIEPKAGWHIYWSNPGDTGYAPATDWTMASGFRAGPLQHPAPTRLVLQGLVSYVHEGPVTLLQDIATPALGAEGGPQRLAVHLDLLICSQGSCVPDPVDLDLMLPVGTGMKDPAAASLFAAARAALPQTLPGASQFVAAGNTLVLRLPDLRPGLDPAAKPMLFLDQPGLAATQAAPLAKAGDGFVDLTLSVQQAPGTTLSGVVVANGRAQAFAAHRVAALPAAAPKAGFDTTFLIAFGTAVLGGLILNLMPCVFPILSLKAMALARYNSGESHARSEALGYALGVIGTVVALGAVLVALREGGSSAGWAFQLQNPLVVGALFLLVTAIAFNLAGLFELPSISVSRSGDTSGFAGSVGTGALAAFVATPCTGPFMAGALGAAMVMPVLPALGVMAGLGFGIALPFLVLGFVPATRRWIPRPGAWMDKLRRALSLPMFATALGLAWIVGRQSGVSGMTAALAAATVLALGLWWYGARRAAGRSGHVFWPAALAALAILGVGVRPEEVRAGVAVGEADVLHSQPFTAERLAQLSAQHKPVFLYLTADWCLSCKVNEATTLTNPRVAAAFARAGVTVLRGDWTRQDPAIGRFLAQQGRAGVPLYLYVDATGATRELPQVLSPDMLLSLVHPS